MAALLRHAAALPALPEGARSLETRVMGCTSQTWLSLSLAPDGTVLFAGARPPAPRSAPLRSAHLLRPADSDSAVTRGFAALLAEGLRGATPAQLAEVRAS